ncbi:MAG: hypothetical protein E7192_03460 [Erysipelotrichaceae bacterium]|nr:hypothetical protein [Erysipelotrichaceae bacterium]
MSKKIFSVGVIALLFALGLKILLFTDQQSISYRENRDLATNTQLHLSDISSGKFQSVLEEILMDQFPQRYTFVTLKNEMEYNSVSFLYQMIENDYVLNPIGTDGIYQIGNSSVLAQGTMEYSDVTASRIERRIEQMNQLQKDYPEIEMFVYKPTQLHESSILDDANGIVSAGAAYSEIFKSQLDLPYDEFVLDSFDLYQDCFYWTDHHWNHKGSYIGYTQIMELMFGDDADVLVPLEESDCDDLKFFGTFSSRSGYVTEGSPFSVYRFDLPEYKIYNLNGEMEISNTNTFFEADYHEEMDYHYNIAYKVGDGYTKIVNEDNAEKESLLIIGDSYAGPVLPLLAKDFYEITLIYPINYTSLTGNEFNYDAFIRENDVDKILFMYTIENYFYSDEWGDRYLAFDVIREEK